MPKHWFVAVSAWTSKIIVSLVQIVSIRTLLLYLGEERYAVYVIAYSLTSWFVLSDFGIGLSLQNFISECRAKKESYDKYLLASLQIAVVLFFAMAALILIISSPVQDILFRKFFANTNLNSLPIVFTVGIVTLANVIANYVFRVYYAEHKGYISNILPALAAVCSMTLIFFINRYSHDKQSIMTALLVFTLPNLIFTVIPFIKVFKKFFIKLFDVNASVIKSLLLRSAKFQGIAVLGVIYAQTDYIVISQTLHPKSIIAYSIFMRVFMFFSFIYTSLLSASWPVFSEMYVEKKYGELRSKIKQYITYAAFLITAGTAAVYICSGLIVKILAPGTGIIPEAFLILLLGIYMLVKSYSDTLSAMLQSFNVLKIFWISMPFQIILNIILQYILSKKYGPEGIVAGLIISLLLTTCWVLPLKLNNLLRNRK
jgi:O-antigen/teichoic acid export membrane protein